MKAISVKQPWAFLIFHGKNVENRTWPTKFRGRVLIHVSATNAKDWPKIVKLIPGAWDLLSDKQDDYKYSAIIGSVEIVDCVINHPSIWAEKTPMAYLGKLIIECQPPIYNWVLANPIMFPEPIPAKGSLSFWDYPNILAESEEKDGPLFCHCQLPVKEEIQVMKMIDHLECRYCGGIWYK